MNRHSNIDSIIDSLMYSNEFHGAMFLIKLGGSLLDDNTLLATLCDDLKLLAAAGIKIILVHGGSVAINQQLTKQNLKSQFIDGLRVTPPRIIDVIEMTLCGQVNKKIVRKLNSIGLHAVGLSGTDDNMMQCDYYNKKYGCVGTIKAINIDFISSIILNPKLSYQIIPVVAPIGVDTDGNPVNINADYVASFLANALKADKLIYLTDQDGIYDENGNIFSELSDLNLQKLIDSNVVKGGMLTKAKATLNILNDHLDHVHILNGKKKHILINELFTVKGAGTLCKKTSTISKKLETTHA